MRRLAATILLGIMFTPALAFPSVCKVADSRCSNIEIPAENGSVPAYFYRDSRDAVLYEKSETSLVPCIAASTFVRDAADENWRHVDFQISVDVRRFGDGIIKSKPFFVGLRSFPRSMIFCCNIINGVTEARSAANAVYSLGLTGQKRAGVFRKHTIVYRGRWYANTLNGLFGEMIQLLKYEASFNRNRRSWRMSEIRHLVFCESYDTGPNWELIDFGDRQITHQNPCALGQRHLIELPLHCLGLSLHDGHLLCEGLISAYAGGAHLIQLAAENHVLRDANTDSYNSQKGNKPSGPSGTPRRPISGGFLFFLGAALLKVALDSTDAPSNPLWLVFGAWTAGVIASAFIVQGVLLAIGGVGLFYGEVPLL
jgi:hypothetical protein